MSKLTSFLQLIHVCNVWYTCDEFMRVTEIEHVTCMNIPDAVPGSVVRVSDSVPPVRVSIALMHTVTTPSVSFTVYMTGSNPTRITAINHSHYLGININPYMSIKGVFE